MVTARAADGQPVGVTINSFASVSLEPPLVLWSLGLQSPSLAVFEACSHYAVNVLAADQVEWSQRFSQSQDDKFAGIAWDRSPLGSPRLTDALAWIDCSPRTQDSGLK